MNPRDFSRLASELVNATRAAELRTAISRAYYATYNVSVEMLRDMGFRINRGPGGHGEVRNYLSNCGDPEVTRVASQLSDLHHKRIRADYDLNRGDVENQTTARALVEQARRMIQILDQCRSDPRRTQIVRAMQDWERRISR